eukprot:TRINITY_DN15817_c0_g1_i1.p1 TRINITY_DN15817_c0_g1~~TRINITY_DN15817_c0_g1_i1.p1  ORF type:complete len:551 (+),score=99.06 TRINITY_DN15817_c0_g1_i1:110-1762(+)
MASSPSSGASASGSPSPSASAQQQEQQQWQFDVADAQFAEENDQEATDAESSPSRCTGAQLAAQARATNAAVGAGGHAPVRVPRARRSSTGLGLQHLDSNGLGTSAADSRWVDPLACSALCQLILDDRKSGGTALFSPRPGDGSSLGARRRALPPSLYAEAVAPFLRFDTPLPNMLYAFGGRNQSRGPLDTVEMFDSWHGRWVSCARMPTRRAGSAAALLPDNRIIVIGGYNDRGIAEGLLATCDLYDPFTRSWDLAGAAPLARKRWGHGCASLGGKVYVVGGCSLQPDAMPQEAFMETLRCCEVYSPEENRWTTCAPLQIARSGSRVVALDERYLAAIGGCDDVFGRAETQPTVELFDSMTGCWSLLNTRLNSPRTTAAVAPLDSRRLLVVGGAPSLASAEVFNLRVPGEGGAPARAAAALEGEDVVMQEQESTANAVGNEREEEEEPAPMQVEDMPEGRMGCQAAVLNLPALGSDFPFATRPCVAVVGGERCDENVGGEWPRVRQFQSIPVFDVIEGKWRKDPERYMPPMASARTAVALCVGVGHVTP